MHEYILFSQLPFQREKQVISILTGYTGAQAVPIHEQVLVYAQVREETQTVSKKVRTNASQSQNQSQGLSYQKLWREVVTNKDGICNGKDWHFRAEQTPEPGVQTFISRDVTEHAAEAGELERFKQPDWYSFKRQYTIAGSRFVHGNIIVRVYRLLVPQEPKTESPVDIPPLSIKDMKLVDASGSLIIEAVVRTATSDKEISDQARKELLNIQNMLDGAIDLYTPDRLALDTRARNG